jgi:phosphatidylglycerophosphate synthase
MTKGKSPRRQNRSFLVDAEQRLIKWILPQIPKKISSLHLTTFGMIGSLLGSIGLICCNWSLYWLPAVVIGVTMNWFGDSLDGSLARYRKEERPRFGFLVDHTCDLFSQITLIVAFGLSPFLSLVAALVILLCYLLFSAYTYIRAAAHHVHQMSYIGVGATEFRILMIAWASFGATIGLREPLVNGFSGLDISILILAAAAVVGLGLKAVGDARQVALEDAREAITVETANISAPAGLPHLTLDASA